MIEPEHYTTREMLAVESRMAERAQEMADSRTHGVGEGTRKAVLVPGMVFVLEPVVWRDGAAAIP